MKNVKLISAASLALALLAPGLASASSVWHWSAGAQGYTEDWSHFRSAKTRTDVMDELRAARSDRRLGVFSFSVWYPAAQPGTPRTRAEVMQEVLDMTPAERARRSQLLIG